MLLLSSRPHLVRKPGKGPSSRAAWMCRVCLGAGGRPAQAPSAPAGPRPRTPSPGPKVWSFEMTGVAPRGSGAVSGVKTDCLHMSVAEVSSARQSFPSRSRGGENAGGRRCGRRSLVPAAVRVRGSVCAWFCVCVVLRDGLLPPGRCRVVPEVTLTRPRVLRFQSLCSWLSVMH